MAAHEYLKNEFTEDEKYHNLVKWLKYGVCPYLGISKKSYGYCHITHHEGGPENLRSFSALCSALLFKISPCSKTAARLI